ncbi:MAG: hypothetical protein QOJ29_112 [Thermoleophilaceae bacterium]|nr:hypothetical protein [Thermoleophilaceae bacterium]
MDTFSAVVLGSLLVIFAGFVLIGWIWQNRPASDITDRGANEKLGGMIEIEEREVPQMVAASNEYRRKRGAPERTEEEFRQKIGAEQKELLDEAEAEASAPARV